MNKLLIAVAVFTIVITSCNSNDKKASEETGVEKAAPKTQADSLMVDVMDGHNNGMARLGKINTMQKNIQVVLDSIAALPAKAKAAAAPYKAKLEGIMEDLKTSRDGMEKWMDEFSMDSEVNNMERRIKYLTDEKWKVTKVKDAIISSLQRADSVLKAKF